MDSEAFFAYDPTELEIAFGSPGRQSRVTVAFRQLLVLPHVVVLVVLRLPLLPLMIVGWFAALVLGRLPRWIAVYAMSVIAYSVRVNAYAYMVADKFPPFVFTPDDYAVSVEIRASQLSRVTVFFRWLLALPVAIVSGLVSTGLVVFSPILWLLTLVRGRMPRPLFSAAAAVIRYQARLNAYSHLVTDSYPRGLFGDDDEWRTAPEGSGRDSRVPLSRGAKRLVALMLVLGICAPIGYIVLLVELSSPSFPTTPALIAAEHRLDRALSTVTNPSIGCPSGDAGLPCLDTRTRHLSEALDRLASIMVGLPAARMSRVQALGDFILVARARHIASKLGDIARAKSRSDYDARLSNVLISISILEDDASSIGLHL